LFSKSLTFFFFLDKVILVIIILINDIHLQVLLASGL
jgi:hypothetical protein